MFLTLANVKANQPVIDLQVISAINASSTLSKTQLAKQYIEMTNQTTQLAKTAATLDSQLRNLELQLSAVTGNLGRVKDIGDAMAVLSDFAEFNTDALGVVYSSNGLKLDPAKPADISKRLEKAFPAKEEKDGELSSPIRDHYQQAAMRDSLVAAEATINGAKTRQAQAEKAIYTVDATQTQKDALDVNNRLLSEVLLEMQRNNLLVAHLVRAQTSLYYTGVSDSRPAKLTKTRSEVLKETFSGENATILNNKKPSIGRNIFRR
jgi:hypothetical protein